MRGLLVTVLGLSGCYAPAREQPCAVRCDPIALACPAHLSCERGFCRAPGDETPGDETCGAVDGGMELDAVRDATMVDGPPQPNICPASYATTASGRRIRYDSTLQSWEAANADCVNDLSGEPLKTHLVVITSDLELSEVQALEAQAVPWIGLTDRRVRNTFLWVTKETTSYPPAPATAGSPWAAGEPSALSTDNCVYMKTANLFTSGGCTVGRPSFCECDVHADDPARY